MRNSRKKRTRPQAPRSRSSKTQPQTTPAVGSTGSTFGLGTNGAFDSKPALGTGSTTTGFGSKTTSALVAKPSMFGAPTTSTTLAFRTPAPAPAVGTAFSFGALTTPAFGAPAPAPTGGGFGTAGGGGLFGATSASTTPGAFAFAPPKPPGTEAFGVLAPSGGMFGSTTPAPSAGAFSFGGTTPAPAAGGFNNFGSTCGSSASAPAPGSGFGAPATGSLFGSGSTASASGGGFGSALTQQHPYGAPGNASFGSGALEQKIKGIKHSSQQLYVRFERGGHTSGIGASDQGGSNLSGQASPSLGFAYRRTPRSSAHIHPRGLGGAKRGVWGGRRGSSSSVLLPRASSSRLLLEGVLTPSGKSIISPDVYLSGGKSMKRIIFPSGVVEDAGQRSTASTTPRTVMPVKEDEEGEEGVDGMQDGQQRLANEEGKTTDPALGKGLKRPAVVTVQDLFTLNEKKVRKNPEAMGHRRQSGVAAARGRTTYSMPDTDDESSVADNASDNDGAPPTPRGRKEVGDRVKDLSSQSPTNPSPPVLKPSPLSRRPPSPPQRRALRNPEDAEAAKIFRPLLADPESQVLSLLGNAWETAPEEPKHEATRGTHSRRSWACIY